MQRVYPPAPIVGVGAAVIREGRVLLVKRGQEPALGQWTLPGGVVELGESLEEAVKREIWEECHIRIEIEGIAGVVERIQRDELGRVKYHYVIIDYKASYLGGELRPGSDVEEADWFCLDRLDDYELSQGLRDFLKKL